MFGRGTTGDTTINRWDYTVRWTSEHMSQEELWPMKFKYDELGEKALNKLNEISPPKWQSTKPADGKVQTDDIATTDPTPKPAGKKRDLYAVLQEHHTKHEELDALWQQIWTVPDWVDWEQIARGQDVFYRYGGAALTGLAFQSLLGGMAAQKVVETLARTGGFSPRIARHRLYETTQHILQCTRSLESMQPGGEGFAATVRVRLLHAAVRQRILKLNETRPDYYSVKDWGIPINDLDSIGTIATFSSTLVYMSWPRQGIHIREREADDYIALWRYVAWVIGCPTDFFANKAKARAIMECLFLYEIEPSDVSRLLANNIIVCLEGQPPTYTSAKMLAASARWLNGDKLSDALGVEDPGLYYRALMAGQCLVFMFFAYVYRAVPFLDRRKIAFMRKALWMAVVENKHGLGGTLSVFEFRYIPQYSTITDRAELEGKPIDRSVERRNLQALLIAGGVCGMAMVAGLRVLGIAITR